MARRGLGHLCACTRRTAAKVRSWLGWVWSRVAREPGYIEAVADLAVAVADLFLRDHALRRVVREAARTFVVVMRSILRRDDHTSPTDVGTPWDGDPDWNWA